MRDSQREGGGGTDLDEPACGALPNQRQICCQTAQAYYYCYDHYNVMNNQRLLLHGDHDKQNNHRIEHKAALLLPPSPPLLSRPESPHYQEPPRHPHKHTPLAINITQENNDHGNDSVIAMVM